MTSSTGQQPPTLTIHWVTWSVWSRDLVQYVTSWSVRCQVADLKETIVAEEWADDVTRHCWHRCVGWGTLCVLCVYRDIPPILEFAVLHTIVRSIYKRNLCFSTCSYLYTRPWSCCLYVHNLQNLQMLFLCLHRISSWYSCIAVFKTLITKYIIYDWFLILLLSTACSYVLY